MGLTAAGMPYPDPDDLLSQVDLDIKALAEAIVSPVVTSTSGLTLAAGWGSLVFRGRKMLGGTVARLHIEATRTGAALTAAGSGNLSPDVDVVTLPVTWWPSRIQYLQGNKFSLGFWQTQLSTVGVVSVTAGPPTTAINTGDTLVIQQLVDLV